MQTQRKGELTRKHILEKARHLFNEKGIGMTIEQLATELELTKSRITNHYPTKDSLFSAIMLEYETKLALYYTDFEWRDGGADFSNLKKFIHGVMWIQFEYRCSMAYAATIMPTGNELATRIEATASANRTSIQNRLKTMIDKGLLEARILDKKEFSIFLAGYLNLLTTWVLTFELYQAQFKPAMIIDTYLSAIFRCYQPYLTRKGKLNFRAAKLQL